MKAGRTRLFLVRHGELTTSKEWRFVGHTDVEMNDAGVMQIKRIAEKLKGVDIEVLMSSDLKRARKSAEIIGEVIGQRNSVYSSFREINLGHWEGMTREEIVDKFKEEFEKRSLDISNFRVEKGESFIDLKNRVIPFLTATLDKHKGKNLLLAAHGGVNRVIICHALGLDIENIVRIDQAYGCLNIIDFFDDVPVVRLINETDSSCF
jgi:broad specificity phosphatase PhoE